MSAGSKDFRETWVDDTRHAVVTFVDVTTAAQTLVRGHLSGPAAAHCLTEALASAALLGGEMSEKDETLIVQLKCTGALGGYNVECTAAGTLRGYTERKTLDDYDASPERCTMAAVRRRLLGETRYQVTRSVPGRILSQGVAETLDGYLAESLQRKARMRLDVAVNLESEVLAARGVLVEDMPDLVGESVAAKVQDVRALTVAARTLLAKLDLRQAELRKREDLSFACRCSAERASEMVAALTESERAELPPTLSVTCHMCGRTFTIPTA